MARVLNSGQLVVHSWSLGALSLTLLNILDMSTSELAYNDRYVYFAVIKTGSVVIQAGPRTLKVGSDSMIMIDVDGPHTQRFDRYLSAIMLRVSREALADYGGFGERRLGLFAPNMARSDVRAVADTVALVAQQIDRASLELRRRQGEHLLSVFSLIVDDRGTAPRRCGSATLLRAKRFISQNIGNVDLNVKLIVSAVGASEAHLHRLFRADGCPPMRYVLNQRLQLAAEMLTRSGGRRLQIKEIAYRCGFQNHAHFSRTFRQRFGASPRAAATIGLDVDRACADDTTRSGLPSFSKTDISIT